MATDMWNETETCEAAAQRLQQEVHRLERAETVMRLTLDQFQRPVPMLLWCPACRSRHIDEGDFAEKVHHTHACQTCGLVWRPAIVATVGVQFLPGFRNATAAPGSAGKGEADRG